jgi:hypothetical protein
VESTGFPPPDEVAYFKTVTKRRSTRKERTMLYTIAVVLILLWLLGIVTSYTISGFVHILLVIAVVLILVRIIQGRRAL